MVVRAENTGLAVASLEAILAPTIETDAAL
jgi:hypothetical protein